VPGAIVSGCAGAGAGVGTVAAVTVRLRNGRPSAADPDVVAMPLGQRQRIQYLFSEFGKTGEVARKRVRASSVPTAGVGRVEYLGCPLAKLSGRFLPMVTASR
jgi:hypothetical protein